MKPTFNVFITMNPGSQSLERDLSVEGQQSFGECGAGRLHAGYAGRAELPDNLAALFRPVVDGSERGQFLSLSHNPRDLVSFWDVDEMAPTCYQTLRSTPFARSSLDLSLLPQCDKGHDGSRLCTDRRDHVGPDRISLYKQAQFRPVSPMPNLNFHRLQCCNGGVNCQHVPFGISVLNARFYAYGFTDAKVLAKKMVAP